MARSTALYDPAPLLAIVPTVDEDTDVSIGDLLGVSDRTIARWRCGTVKVTEANADRAACRLGLHPANIWPEYWGNCPDEEFDLGD